jgi:hypothetical protein
MIAPSAQPPRRGQREIRSLPAVERCESISRLRNRSRSRRRLTGARPHSSIGCESKRIGFFFLRGSPRSGKLPRRL